MTTSKTIYVYIDWVEIGKPILPGVLHCERIRGKEVFSFNCDKGWLNHKEFRVLDPDLGQYLSIQSLVNKALARH